LISDVLIDHVETPGLEGIGKASYLASLRLVHNAFSDYHEEIELIVADDDNAVSYVRLTGTHDGDLMRSHRPAPRSTSERWGSSGSLTVRRSSDGVLVTP